MDAIMKQANARVGANVDSLMLEAMSTAFVALFIGLCCAPIMAYLAHFAKRIGGRPGVVDFIQAIVGIPILSAAVGLALGVIRWAINRPAYAQPLMT
jgi:hypothetical protein